MKKCKASWFSVGMASLIGSSLFLGCQSTSDGNGVAGQGTVTDPYEVDWKQVEQVAANPQGSGEDDSGDQVKLDDRVIAAATLKNARDQAVQVIIQASQSQDPFHRANAIEAARHVPDRLMPMIRLALDDDAHVVRFTALTIVGQTRARDFAPLAERVEEDCKTQLRALYKKLKDEGYRLSANDRAVIRTELGYIQSVQGAALFAQRMCGKKTDISFLADMLVSSNPSVRGNAAMLLGHMDDKSALPMLKELSKKPMSRQAGESVVLTNVQVAEAILRLGDEQALDAIRAAAYSKFHEVRVVAITTLGEQGDRRMNPAFREILAEERNNLELRLAAAYALTFSGDYLGENVVMEAAKGAQPLHRSLAARALGRIPTPEAAKELVSLLNDPNRQVQLAAAAAIAKATDRR